MGSPENNNRDAAERPDSGAVMLGALDLIRLQAYPQNTSRQERTIAGSGASTDPLQDSFRFSRSDNPGASITPLQKRLLGSEGSTIGSKSDGLNKEAPRSPVEPDKVQPVVEKTLLPDSRPKGEYGTEVPKSDKAKLSSRAPESVTKGLESTGTNTAPPLGSRGPSGGDTSQSNDVKEPSKSREAREETSEKTSLPITPEKLDKPIEWTKNPDGSLTAILDHAESGYKLHLTSKNADDPAAGLETIRTEFSNGRPDRNYIKKPDGWYQQKSSGDVHMQGDLLGDSKTGRFTQDLRSTVAGKSGALKETTRTLDYLTDGGSVHTINRMDGTSTSKYFDKDGEPTTWIETEKNGKESGFKATKLSDGQIQWTSTSPGTFLEKHSDRYNLRIEDNGNVTWENQPRANKNSIPEKKHILNSAGDHVVDGDGIKYAFNHRGDIVSMKYDKQVQFEGRTIDQIDIAYRGGQKGESKIIDSLTLKLNGKVVETLNREHTNNEDQHKAKNTWISIDSQGKQTRRIGDYAINEKGHLLTTEPVIERAGTRSAASTPQFIIRDPLKQVTDTTDSYHKPAAGLDIRVPGESGYDGKSETSKSVEDNLFAQREKLEKRDSANSRDNTNRNPFEYFQGTLKEAMAESARTGKPLVFKFTASWCGPCESMKPYMQKAIQQYGNDAIFVEADIDKPEYKNLSQHYKIQNVPTTMVASIEKDRFGHLGLHKVDANTGLMNPSGLNHFLQPSISTARRQMRDRGFGKDRQQPERNQWANPENGGKVAKLDELDFRTAELYKWVV